MRFLAKPHRWMIIFTVILVGAFTFVLLDTFVIPKSLADVTSIDPPQQTTDTSFAAAASVADNSYADENIKITIENDYVDDTAVYIADIQISDASYLQSAFAGSTFGRNIKETTSAIAQENNAILAINGDYYGFRNSGYVLRNGVLYRDSAGGYQDLVIDKNGDFSIIDENGTGITSLNTADIWQIFSFGPALIEDGEIVVDSTSEVSKSMNSNPRTAIGQVSALHYIFIVSDGRTDESAGLTLLELADEFAERGCTIAYNLDGGGSSTMYFNGQIVNNPTDGRSLGEREVSDIVYIGY
jgi:exopolysaccharide biosynthesis protein